VSAQVALDVQDRPRARPDVTSNKEQMMGKQFYVLYFAISPYGGEVPVQAREAAREELELHLGSACQVLAAKEAFEQAGGRRAYWHGARCLEVMNWVNATTAAAQAAYRQAPPRQRTLMDHEVLGEACVDVIAAARYSYTLGEWLDVFLAHFGMSDYCASPEQALRAGRHWLEVAREACPIAAAEEEIRRQCQTELRLPMGAIEARLTPSVRRADARHVA